LSKQKQVLILEEMPRRFRGTIVEKAYKLIPKLKNVDQLQAIMQEFRRRYPRIRKMKKREVIQAFMWLANKICAVYRVPPPNKINIIKYACGSMINILTGEIWVNKSIISFLHELRHWIATCTQRYSNKNNKVQTWAIAVYLLAYSDRLPKLVLMDNYYLTRHRKHTRCCR